MPSPSSSPPQLAIIVDNERRDYFSYTGSSWSSTPFDGFFNETAASQSDGDGGQLSFVFNGTSVAFFGITPNRTQTFSYSIDRSTPFTDTSFGDQNPPSYRQLFKSPTLRDGLHTILLANLSNAAIDFAVVGVGQTTRLGTSSSRSGEGNGGERVVVDSPDPGLKYAGRWRTNRDKYVFGRVGGLPFGNSSAETASVGSTIAYRFAGTALSIYGEFDFSSLGLLTLSFTLDGQTLSQQYRVTTSTPQYLNDSGQEPNFLFHSYDFLTWGGEHTLVVNVTECVNQTFRFDYLTYVPAFERLSDMPRDLWDGVDATTTTMGGAMRGLSKKAAAGVAVGAVLGAVLLAVVVVCCFRKKKAGKWNMYSPLKKITTQTRGPTRNPGSAWGRMPTTPSPPSSSSSPSPATTTTTTTTTAVTPYTIIATRQNLLTPQRPAHFLNVSSLQPGFATPPPASGPGPGPGPGPNNDDSSFPLEPEPPSYEEVAATTTIEQPSSSSSSGVGYIRDVKL